MLKFHFASSAIFDPQRETNLYLLFCVTLYIFKQQKCLQLRFLGIFYAFVLQNTLYGLLLQNYAHVEFLIFQSIFVHFGSFQDAFSLLKGD